MSTGSKQGACEHSESASPAFSRHCSEGSCWNYQDSCPRHWDRGYRPSAPCALEGEHR